MNKHANRFALALGGLLAACAPADLPRGSTGELEDTGQLAEELYGQ